MFPRRRISLTYPESSNTCTRHPSSNFGKHAGVLIVTRPECSMCLSYLGAFHRYRRLAFISLMCCIRCFSLSSSYTRLSLPISVLRRIHSRCTEINTKGSNAKLIYKKEWHSKHLWPKIRVFSWIKSSLKAIVSKCSKMLYCFHNVSTSGEISKAYSVSIRW